VDCENTILQRFEFMKPAHVVPLKTSYTPVGYNTTNYSERVCDCRFGKAPICDECNGYAMIQCDVHPFILGPAMINVNRYGAIENLKENIVNTIVCTKCNGSNFIPCRCHNARHRGRWCNKCNNTGMLRVKH
jgi:hypothetical protein